jgi:uncharacterized membrane protein
VSLDDWIIALHVLSAVAYVAAIVLFWVLIAAVRRLDTPDATIALGPVSRLGTVVVGIGGVGTLVFGIWLALSVGDYDLWDAWIILAIALWAIAGAFGQRTGVEYTRGVRKAIELRDAGQPGANAELLALNRTQNGVILHAVVTVTVLLILIDMIWKPGA